MSKLGVINIIPQIQNCSHMNNHGFISIRNAPATTCNLMLSFVQLINTLHNINGFICAFLLGFIVTIPMHTLEKLLLVLLLGQQINKTIPWTTLDLMAFSLQRRIQLKMYPICIQHLKDGKTPYVAGIYLVCIQEVLVSYT